MKTADRLLTRLEDLAHLLAKIVDQYRQLLLEREINNQIETHQASTRPRRRREVTR